MKNYATKVCLKLNPIFCVTWTTEKIEHGQGMLRLIEGQFKLWKIKTLCRLSWWANLFNYRQTPDQDFSSLPDPFGNKEMGGGDWTAEPHKPPVGRNDKGIDQVRPLTQYLLFAFCKKNHCFAWWAKQWGKTLYSSVPSINSLVLVLDP